MNQNIQHLHRFNTLLEQDIDTDARLNDLVLSARLPIKNSLTTSTLSVKDIDEKDLSKLFP